MEFKSSDIGIGKRIGSVETARKRMLFDAKICRKMNQWREEGHVNPRPKFHVLTTNKDIPSNKNVMWITKSKRVLIPT